MGWDLHRHGERSEREHHAQGIISVQQQAWAAWCCCAWGGDATTFGVQAPKALESASFQRRSALPCSLHAWPRACNLLLLAWARPSQASVQPEVAAAARMLLWLMSICRRSKSPISRGSQLTTHADGPFVPGICLRHTRTRRVRAPNTVGRRCEHEFACRQRLWTFDGSPSTIVGSFGGLER